MMISKMRVRISEIMRDEAQDPYESDGFVGPSIVQHIETQAQKWQRRDDRLRRMREEKALIHEGAETEGSLCKRIYQSKKVRAS